MGLSGNSIDYLRAFFGGLGISFTPCVYPLIPIVAGYIGLKEGITKVRGFTLSVFYVIGVAVTYSILGIFASLTGRMFGTVSSHPLTYLFVGVVIVLFGLSMSGLFIIPLPNIVKRTQFKNQGFFSAFLLGLSSGLIVSPCLTPVLGSILVYLATKKNVVYGATLLFSFACGMGFILILTGTFSSALLGILPKSGKWMVYLKWLYSFVLVGAGIYFIYIGIRRF